MNILFGVHLDERIDTHEIAQFYLHQLSQDPHTFFLVLSLDDQPEKTDWHFKKVREELPLRARKNIRIVRPDNSSHDRAFFDPYRSSFTTIVRELKKYLLPNERVNVVSFGGNALSCYHYVSSGAHKVIEEEMGNHRMGIRYANLRLIYPRRPWLTEKSDAHRKQEPRKILHKRPK